ncbi:hypothetical protein [Oceanitalea stevensii]|uniref:PucR family transcriptional regulator n=1 Tax=Oceanitalea stevensii TaxID=2763072 RepID=A0ABR8Z249_9MICO|nr:hypothetical protein [Oceanitalea stevensii]MBD8062404.1 hypothetical protein [Oceanitalea stevensii]
MTTDHTLAPDTWASALDSTGTEDEAWLHAGGIVLGDDDAVACAAGAVRAAAGGDGLSMWLIALDEDGRSTGLVVELAGLADAPPPGEVLTVLTRMSRAMDRVSPLGSLVVALASPGGGDRVAREVRWGDAVADAARSGVLPVRAVVAVGAHRARLLHAAVRR